MLRKLKTGFLLLLICLLSIKGLTQIGSHCFTPGSIIKNYFGYELGNPIRENWFVDGLIIIEAPGYKTITVSANRENGYLKKKILLPNLEPLVTKKELGYTLKPGECDIKMNVGDFKLNRYKDLLYYDKNKSMYSQSNEVSLAFNSDNLESAVHDFLEFSSLLNENEDEDENENGNEDEDFFRDESKTLSIGLEFNQFNIDCIAMNDLIFFNVAGKVIVKDALGGDIGVYPFDVKCNASKSYELGSVNFMDFANDFVVGKAGADIWHSAIEDVVYEFSKSLDLKKLIDLRELAQKENLSKPLLKIQKGAFLGAAPKDLITSIVTIKTGSGHGSGCLISADGYIVTNYHVAPSSKDTISVILHGGEVYKAELVRSDFTFDLALLKIESETPFCSVMPVGEVKNKLGDKVMVIGTPADPSLGQTITKGIVSGFRQVRGKSLIQTDAHINPGNSGGALFNESGELIGVVSSKAAGAIVEGVGFAIPAPYIFERLKLEY